MRGQDETAFAVAVRSRERVLLRTAYALTGDWHAAQDLSQTALSRLFAHWPLKDEGTVDAWLLRTLSRAWIDETRRPWWRRERSTDQLPEQQIGQDEGTGEHIAALFRVLDRLPPRQRACVILRYMDDLSIEQTADALGCSVGTVSSHTSRALSTLRAAIGTEPVTRTP